MRRQIFGNFSSSLVVIFPIYWLFRSMNLLFAKHTLIHHANRIAFLTHDHDQSHWVDTCFYVSFFFSNDKRTTEEWKKIGMSFSFGTLCTCSKLVRYVSFKTHFENYFHCKFDSYAVQFLRWNHNEASEFKTKKNNRRMNTVLNAFVAIRVFDKVSKSNGIRLLHQANDTSDVRHIFLSFTVSVCKRRFFDFIIDEKSIISSHFFLYGYQRLKLNFSFFLFVFPRYQRLFLFFFCFRKFFSSFSFFLEKNFSHFFPATLSSMRNLPENWLGYRQRKMCYVQWKIISENHANPILDYNKSRINSRTPFVHGWPCWCN